LKKFGVRLSKDNIKEIIEGNADTMDGLVQELFKYDQTIAAYPDISGPTGKLIKESGKTILNN
jgi:hypothetical protein